MRARRRFQRGSIKACGDVWVIRWRVDEVVGGSIVRRQKQERWDKSEYPTKPMVARELNRRLGEINSVEYRPKVNVTFKQFAEAWQEKVMGQLAPSTVVNYKSHINHYLIPFFGSYELRDIRGELVQSFIVGLNKSRKTVRNIYVTLQAMWRSAQAWEYVEHDIKKGVTFGPATRKQQFFFSAEEIHRILNVAQEPHRTFYGLAAETGLRAGELAGIRVDDLDLASGVLQVRQSVWRGQVKETKTRSGMRVIELSSHLTGMLRTMLDSWRPNDGRFLFAGDGGRPWDPTIVLKEYFHPLLRQLGIVVPKGTGFHAFRHANATFMDSLGAPDKVRQSRLGHSSIEVTKNIYTHVVGSDARRVADELGEKVWGQLSADVNGGEVAKTVNSGYLN